MRGLSRGVIAGAVGTTVIDAVTWVDMAVRGRSASDTPARTIAAGLDQLDVQVPGTREQRRDRETALGALGGIVTGVTVGAATGIARDSGLRLSPVLGSVVTGALAMAASDGAATLTGVTDPRKWSTEDWVSDVVPHLAFGVATHSTLRALERSDVLTPPVVRASSGLVVRSFLAGVASGSRSSLGWAVAAFGRPRPTKVGRAGAALAVVGELAGDKSPKAPPRSAPPGAVPRFAGAAAAAAALSARQGAAADLPLVAASAGAALGTFGGIALREVMTERFGTWPAALIEDGLASGLALLSVRGQRPVTL